MTKAKEAALFLSTFNSWRRGNDSTEAFDPAEVGAAIDDAVNLLRRYDEMERENAALREKVDDWENAVAHALDNRSEEQHCTCVAPLVGKVKQLERENVVLHATLSVFEAVSKEAQS